MTTFGRSGYLHRALAAGVAGFVVKHASAGALVHAVRKCAGGERVIGPGLAGSA